MKVLLTGGAGFIGSHTTDRLIQAGHEVVIVDNLSTGKRENINPKAKFYHLDIRDHDLRTVFQKEKPDIVNHHAAQISVPFSVSNPHLDAEINILGLINLIRLSVEFKVKKVIYISSGGAIYGETKNLPTPESNNIYPESPYGISKMVGENYLYFAQKQFGLNYTTLRYANVYGPRQSVIHEAGVVAIFTNNLLSNKTSTIFRYSDQPEGNTRDYVYVKDVAEINLIVMDKGENEAFNIANSIETSTLDLYEKICKILGKEMKPQFSDPRQGDLKRSCLNIEKVNSLLKWKPKYHLEEGLIETVSYIKQNF